MPNRMLRDWTKSEKINSLSVQGERFFTRLIMKVDDYGRLYADTRLLKADCFPLLLDTVREADITRWLTECEKAGLIVLYEGDNKKYLQINDFRQRLDKAKAKFPEPPTNDTNPLTTVNEIPAEVEEEKEIELEEEKEESSGATAPAPKKNIGMKNGDNAVNSSPAAKTEFEKRQDNFYNSLLPYLDLFGKKMLRDFFNYWSEPNKSHTKMKWELETTWDLKKRLERWQRNDEKFNKNNSAAVNQQPQGQATTNSPKTLWDEVLYLKDRYCEGELDVGLVRPEHYDVLVTHNCIKPGMINASTPEKVDQQKMNLVLSYFEFVKQQEDAKATA